jgi:hypothetical protein
LFGLLVCLLAQVSVWSGMLVSVELSGLVPSLGLLVCLRIQVSTRSGVLVSVELSGSVSNRGGLLVVRTSVRLWPSSLLLSLGNLKRMWRRGRGHKLLGVRIAVVCLPSGFDNGRLSKESGQVDPDEVWVVLGVTGGKVGLRSGGSCCIDAENVQNACYSDK